VAGSVQMRTPIPHWPLASRQRTAMRVLVRREGPAWYSSAGMGTTPICRAGSWGVHQPAGHLLCQVGGALGRIVFGQHVVAVEEQPVDGGDTARSGINAHHGPLALGRVQVERLLGCHHKRQQSRHQLRLAVEEAFDDNLMITGGQHTPQLPPTPVALLGKVACRRQSSFLATWHPTHVDIEHLPLLRIGMAIALAVASVDGLDCGLHLRHRLLGTGIERVLHHRLFGAAFPPKGGLLGRVRPQASIDLDQAVRPQRAGR
jgi:hypothetical protein